VSRILQLALVAPVVLGVWIAGAAGARAYVRQTVEGDPSTFLFWERRNIEINAAYETCTDAAALDVQTAVLEAMQAWEVPGDGCTDIRLLEGEAPSALNTNLDGGRHDGENRVVWRQDEWPDIADSNALAITTIVYDRSSGEIQDADIDVNGFSFFWTVTDEAGAIDNDVQNTITHEMGHLIGLGHSPDTDATMFASSPGGETSKRSLAPDDVMGVCTIYPTGGATPRGLGVTRGMLTSGSTCAVGVAEELPSTGSGTIAVVLALMLIRIRRRRLPSG
jgi:hypothetical protein